jgi:tetratricopeptide (TPR) repeat protein
LLHAKTAIGAHEEAAVLFDRLDEAVENYREQGEDEEKGLRYLIEWSLLALRFTPEQRDDFVCMPIYDRLFEALETGPEKLRFQKVRAQLQLIRHYEFWQTKGGKQDKLPPEDLKKLEDAVSTFPEIAEASIEAHLEQEAWDAVIRLNRYATSYYLTNNQPNHGIRLLKSSLEHLPKTEDYHAADSADLHLQLGQIFLQYKKWDVAIKYFRNALAIYDEGGEDLEMFKYQAEGWIEEAEKRKKMFG